MIAVLCVAKNSIYKTLHDVDCYDINRDCRTFPGGVPIVAHPPCRSWSAYCAHQAKPLPGEKELGPWCVEQLRKWGGVLEHPAHSRLFDACNLPKPGNESKAAECWSMEVEQSWWGDSRKKLTWLAFFGVLPCDLPPIPFVLRDPNGDRRRWQLMSKTQRSATVREFAEWLVSVARMDRMEATS